jgi:hypothetical protein
VGSVAAGVSGLRIGAASIAAQGGNVTVAGGNVTFDVSALQAQGLALLVLDASGAPLQQALVGSLQTVNLASYAGASLGFELLGLGGPLFATPPQQLLRVPASPAQPAAPPAVVDLSGSAPIPASLGLQSGAPALVLGNVSLGSLSAGQALAPGNVTFNVSALQAQGLQLSVLGAGGAPLLQTLTGSLLNVQMSTSAVQFVLLSNGTAVFRSQQLSLQIVTPPPAPPAPRRSVVATFAGVAGGLGAVGTLGLAAFAPAAGAAARAGARAQRDAPRTGKVLKL